jgi:hypothetical protein
MMQERSNKRAAIYQSKQTGSIISVIAVLISMRANRIEYLSEQSNLEEERSNQLAITAIYLTFIPALIDLGNALSLLDELLENSKTEKVNSLAYLSVDELIMSRLFSIIALTLLLNSAYHALEVEQKFAGSIVPNVAGMSV